MVESTRILLRESLVSRYITLRDRLARRLGSVDLAGEALHEIWIRLGEGSDLSPVADPDAYLYRAALNTAANLNAARRRVLGTVEIDDILNLADPAPGPERIAIGRSEVAALHRALKGLTPRQRDVFLESFGGDASHAELAERHGVGVRTIQIDLRDAILHCARRTDRKNLFVRGALRVSRR